MANRTVGGDRKSDHSLNLGNVSVVQESKLLNVSTGNISNVRAIRRVAPERIAEIESGAKTIHQVQRVSCLQAISFDITNMITNV